MRSFDQPVCFSFKELDGDYFLNIKTIDRQPTFYPKIGGRHKDNITGKAFYDTIKADYFALVDFNRVRMLRSGQWNEINNYLSKLDFWNSPVVDPNDNSSSDGSNWVLEGRQNKKYHFIDRRNPNKELMSLGKYLISLSGLKINDRSIY